MTGQMVAALVLAALIVAVLPWLLLRDLRRATRPWWKRLGIELVESPYVPPGTIYLIPRLPDLEPPVLRFAEWDADFRRAKWEFATGERLALDVFRPEQLFKVTVTP